MTHITPMGAKRSIPLQSAYCASKHSIDGFLGSLRVELWHEGLPICVTQVKPTTINTPALRQGAHQARCKAGCPGADPPAEHSGGRHPPRRREAEARSHRGRSRQGGHNEPEDLSPTAVDAALRRIGFEVHYTREPKPEGAPDNLFEPVSGNYKVEGSFSDRAHPRSLYNWFELRPTVKPAATVGAALGALAILRAR